MESESTITRKQWLADLPTSKMVFPKPLTDRLKYIVWRLYTPYHPYLRDAIVFCRIMKHQGRQDFLLGNIAPGQTVESVVASLIGQGYGNHFVAWKDEGELVSLRYMENFAYQYHLRIFEDGEVRGHYEYTPECHPFLHLHAVNSQDRRNEFLKILGNKIIPAPSR